MPDDRDVEWTNADLDLLQSLDAAGTPADQIARRLGRSEVAIADHLPIARARKGAIPVPDGTAPPLTSDDWQGTDEEGDVPPAENSDDEAAWVHVERPS